jgi:hypothetical protein
MRALQIGHRRWCGYRLHFSRLVGVTQLFVGNDSDLIEARSASSGSIGFAASMVMKPQTSPAADKTPCTASITTISFIAMPIYRLFDASSYGRAGIGYRSGTEQISESLLLHHLFRTLRAAIQPILDGLCA